MIEAGRLAAIANRPQISKIDREAASSWLVVGYFPIYRQLYQTCFGRQSLMQPVRALFYCRRQVDNSS